MGALRGAWTARSSYELPEGCCDSLRPSAGRSPAARKRPPEIRNRRTLITHFIRQILSNRLRSRSILERFVDGYASTDTKKGPSPGINVPSRSGHNHTGIEDRSERNCLISFCICAAFYRSGTNRLCCTILVQSQIVIASECTLPITPLSAPHRICSVEWSRTGKAHMCAQFLPLLNRARVPRELRCSMK